MITALKYVRKPLYVDAIQVTPENIEEVATWCQGNIHQDVDNNGSSERYVRVRVLNPKNARQSKAFAGDWILYTDRGYKVYVEKAFLANFDLCDSPDQVNEVKE